MKSYIECLNCKAIEDSNFTSELIAQDWREDFDDEED